MGVLLLLCVLSLMLIGSFLLIRIFSLTRGFEDLSARLDSSFGRNNIYGTIVVCICSLMDLENIIFLPWAPSVFVEKSGGFPNMPLYQSVMLSKSLFLISLSLILGTASEGNTVSSLSLLLSVVLSIYSFCVVILKLKFEDISQFELKLVPKDALVGGGGGVGSGIGCSDLDLEMVEESLNPLAFVEAKADQVYGAEEEVMEKDEKDEEDEEDLIRKSELFLKDSGEYFPSTLRFPDEQVKLLQKQLRHANLKPLEFIPLVDLKREIQDIISKMNRGEECDEETTNRLDHLLMCLDHNEEYKAEQERELSRWVEDHGDFFEEALVVMRRVIPKEIFECSVSTLRSEHHMSVALSKRIFDKKCLWLIRMKKGYIKKLHESDLLGKYSYQAQNLDLVELSAIFWCLPNEFTNDPSGKKKEFKMSLLLELKTMVTLHQEKKLPAIKIRHPAYKDNHKAKNNSALTSILDQSGISP